MARTLAATTTFMLLSGSASAEEARARTSVALLAGYGFEINMVSVGGLTSYGFGFGSRGGVTLPYGVYVGGLFVDHVGTLVRAEDAAKTSSYLGSYHDVYAGPEVGRDFHLRRLLVRPYVGAGVLFAVSRTEVRQWQERDDRLAPFVSPGVVSGLQFGPWTFGFDARTVFPTDGTWRAWSPAILGVLGHGGSNAE